jgi:hypothetical protein
MNLTYYVSQCTQQYRLGSESRAGNRRWDGVEVDGRGWTDERATFTEAGFILTVSEP